jgi:hypothetical protein
MSRRFPRAPFAAFGIAGGDGDLHGAWPVLGRSPASNAHTRAGAAHSPVWNAHGCAQKEHQPGAERTLISEERTLTRVRQTLASVERTRVSAKPTRGDVRRLRSTSGSKVPFVDGSAGLPRNTPHTVDAVSGLPENTHDVSGGSSRLREDVSDAADRLSRLPQNMPDIGGWSRQLPGRMPDSDDDLSWLPENGPGTVGRLPCLQKETAANVSGFFSLPGETPGNAGAFFARGKREGNMGVRDVFWVVQPEFNGEVLFSPRVTTTSLRRSSRIFLDFCRDCKTDAYSLPFLPLRGPRLPRRFVDLVPSVRTFAYLPLGAGARFLEQVLASLRGLNAE